MFYSHGVDKGSHMFYIPISSGKGVSSESPCDQIRVPVGVRRTCMFYKWWPLSFAGRIKIQLPAPASEKPSLCFCSWTRIRALVQMQGPVISWVMGIST